MSSFIGVDFAYVARKKRELLAERHAAAGSSAPSHTESQVVASHDSEDRRAEADSSSGHLRDGHSSNDRVEATLREMKGDGADVSHRVPAGSKMDRAIEMLRAAGDQGDREPQRAPTGSRVDETLKMYRPSNAS